MSKSILIVILLLVVGCEGNCEPQPVIRSHTGEYNPCMDGTTICSWKNEVVGSIYDKPETELEKKVDKLVNQVADLKERLDSGKLPNGCPFDLPTCWKDNTPTLKAYGYGAIHDGSEIKPLFDITIPSGKSTVIKASEDDISVKCLEGK